MSHFASVGFPVDDETQLVEMLATASERANERGDVVDHADGRTVTYRDPSSAVLTIHSDRRGSFECCQPGFGGDFRARWRPLGVVRGTSEFADTRYRVWQALHAPIGTLH